MGYYMGCKKIKFINHGDWSDPELVYKNKRYNYYDIENALLDEYKERNNVETLDDVTSFEKWIKNNKMMIYDIMDDLTSYIKENIDIIASRCICNTASICITDIDDDCDWVKVALVTDDMIKKSRPLKIYNNMNSQSYFNYNGRREYLSEYIRNN